MATFRILDTYKAYKVREQKFTGWLREKAGKLGYFESRRKTQPQNKKIKDRKESVLNSIKVSEIPNLIQLIVSRGEDVPEYLGDVLRDVISQRKEASAYYKPQGKADEGHAHYIEVLEGALKTFESSGRMSVSDLSVAKTAAPGHSKTDLAFNNVFELLQMEDAKNEAIEAGMSGNESEKESQITNESRRTKAKPKRKGKGRRPQKPVKQKVGENPKPVTNSEHLDAILDQGMDFDDGEDDLYFMIYCFFKDFNTTRELIQEQWCDYLEGTLALSTISLVTNTAYELLQRAEKELIAQIPSRSGLRSYHNMANMLFMDVGLAHVDYDEKTAKYEGDQAKMNNAIYEEADWLCLPRYWDLFEWLKNVPPRKVTTQPAFLHKPIIYQAEGAEEKMARDRQILYEMIVECTLIKPLKSDPNFQIPGEDEFTVGLVEMLASRDIPIWLVLASQIHCDVRGLLEEYNCHDQVLAMGERVQSIIGDYITFAKDFDIPIWSVIETTVDEVSCWIIDDCMEPHRTDLHVSHGELEEDQEKYYYLRRNPVLCGLIIFRFSLTMNEIGLLNSNQWGATIAATHTYNALRHELPFFPRWLDMEALILTHSVQRIFWRDHLPSNPGQYSRSYDRSTGMSDMLAQRNSGTMIIKPKKVEERGIAPASVVSQQYWRRFCFNHDKPIRTLPNVEVVLNLAARCEIEKSLAGWHDLLLEVADSDSPFNPGGNLELSISGQQAQLTAQFQTTHTLTNVQLLSALCTRVAQEGFALNFDYFSFHMRCMRVLKAIYDEFESEIVAAGGELDWGRAELPVVPHWIFIWMEGDDEKKALVLERLRSAMEPIVSSEGANQVKYLRDLFGPGKMLKGVGPTGDE
ncbi:uncharacterized protein BP5553_02279 [Venustampulla echinocandica]|uniref:DUF6604 domain-containing protein n=1 Tax=Venustampulla echinocandica TaxID=2656787 RepID=A0A370U3E9_9HELO|nr:uncharacterized protein BP5553_02279 [Venustampulla echinocandica]RDL42300.1 hypothetical protein BP5553_02279 [Venustampulla echinocandica]